MLFKMYLCSSLKHWIGKGSPMRTQMEDIHFTFFRWSGSSIRRAAGYEMICDNNFSQLMMYEVAVNLRAKMFIKYYSIICTLSERKQSIFFDLNKRIPQKSRVTDRWPEATIPQRAFLPSFYAPIILEARKTLLHTSYDRQNIFSEFPISNLTGWNKIILEISIST